MLYDLLPTTLHRRCRPHDDVLIGKTPSLAPPRTAWRALLSAEEPFLTCIHVTSSSVQRSMSDREQYARHPAILPSTSIDRE